MAVIVMVPAARVEMVNDADPPIRPAVPRVVAPLRNVIVSPSVIAPPAEVTFAVNVTA